MTAEEWQRSTDPAAMLEFLRDRGGETRKGRLMPALGAALSDAGCKDPRVLEHCRLTQHVSGCWLVGALLGEVTP